MKNLLLTTMISSFTVISVNAVPNDLLAKLDADEFATRSKAQSDLMKWAESAKKGEIKELKKTYEEAQSPELRLRLFDVLDNSTFMAKPNTRGFVGISMDFKMGGVGIQRVEPGTPAQKVDLRVGDEIIGVDKKDLTDKKANLEEATNFFSNYVKSKNAGEKLELKIRRDGKILEKTLKLGDYDEFNKEFLQQNPQFQFQGRNLQFQRGGNLRLEIKPGGPKLKIKPQIVIPKGKLEPLELEELNKMMELHQNNLNKKRKELDAKKKELLKKSKELRLESKKK